MRRLCHATLRIARYNYTRVVRMAEGYAEAPAGNETLTPDDAARIEEELLDAQSKSYELGLEFKLSQSKVEGIHAAYSNPPRRLHEIIIKFTNQTEPRPTWRVIVEALRSPAVNLPALARKIEAAHFPDLTSSRDVVPETTTGSTAANEVTPLNLQDTPTMRMLTFMPTQSGYGINIIERIGAKYTPLGTLLLKDDTGAVTEGIVAAHPQQPGLISRSILSTWLQGGGREEPVTWATLIDVLKQVGLKQLAQDIEKQARPSQHIHSPPSPAENESKSCVPYSYERRQSVTVKEKLTILNNMFNEVKKAFIKALIDKNIIIVSPIVDALTQLSVDEVGSHQLLDDDYLKDLSQSRDHSELIGKLSFIMDHHLLEYLSENLKVKFDMSEYKDELCNFQEYTPLVLFCAIQKRKIRLCPIFEEIVVRFWEKNYDNVCLHYVERFRQEFRSHYKLHECAIILAYGGDTHESSKTKGIYLIWFFPNCITAILQDQKYLPTIILNRYYVEKLMVKGDCIYRATYQTNSVTPRDSRPQSLKVSKASGPTASEVSPSHGPPYPLLESTSSGQATLESAGASGPTASEVSPSHGPPYPLLESNSSGQATLESAGASGPTASDSCPCMKSSRSNLGTECQERPKIVKKVSSSQLTVECCQKMAAPETMQIGSVTTDGRFAYILYCTSTGYSPVYQYQLSAEKWKDLPSCKHRNSGLVVIKSELTAVGGWEGTRPTKKQVKLRQNKWSDNYPAMKNICSSTAVVSTSDGNVIMIGWCDGNQTAKVELYHVKLGQWYILTSLRIKNVITRLSATICGDQLNVIGDGVNAYSCSLQALPSSDKPTISSLALSWNPLPKLPVKESTAATLCGQLVIVGGRRYDGSPDDSIHQLIEGQWVRIGSMTSGRRQCLVASPSPNKILIVGGCGSEDSVEECVASR